MRYFEAFVSFIRVRLCKMILMVVMEVLFMEIKVMIFEYDDIL